MAFIDYNTKDILALFREQFTAQTGKPFQIGSQEFTLSAVFSYVLGVLINNANASANNRFIETAQGKHLDAIASTFGLSRHDNPRFNAGIDVEYSGTAPLNINISGIPFTLNSEASIGKYKVYQSTISMQAASPDWDFLDAEIAQILPGANPLTHIYPEKTDFEAYNSDFEGDNAFRQYIYTHNALSKGTAPFFEQYTKEAHPGVRDVRVVRQSESEFVAGTVKICVLLSDILTGDYKNVVLNIIRSRLADDNIKIVGQNIELVECEAASIGLGRSFDIMYSLKYAETLQIAGVTRSIMDLHARTVRDFYLKQITNKIGAPFNDSELESMFVRPLKAIDGIKEYIYTLSDGERIYNAICEVSALSSCRTTGDGSPAKDEILNPGKNKHFVFDNNSTYLHVGVVR